MAYPVFMIALPGCASGTGVVASAPGTPPTSFPAIPTTPQTPEQTQTISTFVVGQNGTILRYSGTSWLKMNSGNTDSLYGIWGTSSSNIFAVGYNGTILHYDSISWSKMDSGTTQQLNGVWGTASNDVLAVGNNGTILRYNGTSWSKMISETTNDLYGIWGTSSNDIFATGTWGTILHYNGTSWSKMTSEATVYLPWIWGTANNDVFAIGPLGIILHYNGVSWSGMESETLSWLSGIWGTSSSNVFAIGSGGKILHYDGTSWSVMTSENTQALTKVWGSSSNNIFAVGDNGTILNYNGTSWSKMNAGTMENLNSVWSISENTFKKYAYILNLNNFDIAIFDMDNFTSTKNMSGLSMPRNMCFSNTKRAGNLPKYLYVTNTVNIKRFNLANQSLDSSWNGPDGINVLDLEITPDDKHLYYTDGMGVLKYLSNIDFPTSVQSLLPGYGFIYDIALTPDGSGLFFTYNNNIAFIKTSDHTINSDISITPDDPDRIAINSAGTYAYIGDSFNDKIIVFNIVAKNVEKTINLNIDTNDNFKIGKIVISKDGSKAYVICYNLTPTAAPNYGKIIRLSLDSAGGVTQDAVKINLNPYYANDIFLSSDGQYLWVACCVYGGFNSKIFVIQTSDMSIYNTIDSTNGPVGVAVE